MGKIVKDTIEHRQIYRIYYKILSKKGVQIGPEGFTECDKTLASAINRKNDLEKMGYTILSIKLTRESFQTKIIEEDTNYIDEQEAIQSMSDISKD